MKKEHPTPSLKVVGGAEKIEPTNLRFLDSQIGDISRLSQRDLWVYAYHYADVGDLVGARRLVKRISSFYFTHDVFKDLYRSMMAWHVYSAGHVQNHIAAEYEFFLVVKKSIPLFHQIQFPHKRDFETFCSEFNRLSCFMESL